MIFGVWFFDRLPPFIRLLYVFLGISFDWYIFTAISDFLKSYRLLQRRKKILEWVVKEQLSRNDPN